MSFEMEMLGRELRSREEGFRTGRAEGLESAALGMLGMNLTVEQVYQATKLSMERILELEKQIKK